MSARLELAVFIGDQVWVRDLPVDGSLTLGRADECDIRVNHPSVSRKHCTLHLGERLRVEDLGGANGTFVRELQTRDDPNATEQQRRLLGESREITIGECFHIGSAMLVARRRPEIRPARAAGDRDDLVVRDPEMQALYDQARLAARAIISVLVLGETGVGKEVLAAEIHRASPRAKGPYLSLNCAALSESLLESELFGHEKGSFTGALQARPGLFESASGGTLFLDEVGDLPMSIQVKLLRVLEERKVLRVGARSPRDVDVRFVAATNRDLETEVSRGTFREDLYFRLNGIALTLPPLRKRPTEIEPLVAFFAERACRQLERAPLEFSEEALSALQGYAWPGNVRELRNVVDRAVVLCNGDKVFLEHLPAKLVNGARPAPEAAASMSKSAAPSPAAGRSPEASLVPLEKANGLRSEMGVFERERIVRALEQCAGNQKVAAELLGISRRTLVTRLAEYDIPRPRKKP